jgi:hypothetical protein
MADRDMNIGDILSGMKETGIPGLVLSASIGMAIVWFNVTLGRKILGSPYGLIFIELPQQSSSRILALPLLS